MEREDSHEHAKANCDPVKEGQIFLAAMNKYENDNKGGKKKAKAPQNKDILHIPAAAPSVSVCDYRPKKQNWLINQSIKLVI